MAITYNAGTNTITVTGYTEGTPCTFLDIYNADVAGAWGKVTRQCTNQYCVQAKIVIGDGSTATWFGDSKVQIIFSGLFGSDVWTNTIFAIKTNAHFRLGDVISGKRTGRGVAIHHVDAYRCNLIDGESNDGAVELYSCFVNIVSDSSYSMRFDRITGAKVYNLSSPCTCFFHRSSGVDVYNWNSQKSWQAFQGIAGNIENVILSTIGIAFAIDQNTTADMYVKNVDVDNVSHSLLRGYQSGYDGYIINCTSDSWVCSYVTYTGKFYRQYEFDLKIVDKDEAAINGATVKIWDKDDSLVTNTTTNASGVLATQTLNYGYYNQVGGNVATMQTPHEMRIYKYGKLMLSSKSSIEKVTDWALTMLTDAHITQTTEATVAAYTGITINHTTETITISENHTLDEIYDYCQYDIIASTKQLDQTLHTSDGVNFVSEYSFVVNTGITVTATDQKLSMVSGETYTLTGTAQFAGIIATTTTTRIPIKLSNIIDGSRYWVGKESDGSKIFEGTQSGSGTVTGYYEHTANININIRVRKSSVSVKYKPWIGEGTLVAEAFSLRIRQIQDLIVT